MPNYEADQKLENEKKLTIIVMCYVGIFIVTWTPYAFVSMYSAFIDPKDISPLGATIPAMFAKSSMVWGTILYLYSNSKIRAKFNATLFTKEAPTETSNRNSSKLNY